MIRIKDIAERAGVSPTTVSNVIHGNYKKVSQKTVEKIEKLLAETEYVPSMGAMMLAGGNSRVIGVLAGEPDEEKRHVEAQTFTNILVRSLESEIYRKNYYMLLHFTATPEEGIQFAVDVGVDHERWNGVYRACREHDLDSGVRRILIPGKKKDREQYYKEHLADFAEKYDALFFASDYYAAEAIAVLSDMGICVPDDVSVVGFDDNDSAGLCRPRLTTIHQDVEEKACRAVKKLFDFIQGEREVSMTDRLPVTLVIRDSVKNMESE